MKEKFTWLFKYNPNVKVLMMQKILYHQISKTMETINSEKDNLYNERKYLQPMHLTRS